jgi:hypothetical protein
MKNTHTHTHTHTHTLGGSGTGAAAARRLRTAPAAGVVDDLDDIDIDIGAADDDARRLVDRCGDVKSLAQVIDDDDRRGRRRLIDIVKHDAAWRRIDLPWLHYSFCRRLRDLRLIGV